MGTHSQGVFEGSKPFAVPRTQSGFSPGHQESLSESPPDILGVPSAARVVPQGRTLSQGNLSLSLAPIQLPNLQAHRGE